MNRLFKDCKHGRLEPHYPPNESGKQSSVQCEGATEPSQTDIIISLMSSLEDCPDCGGIGASMSGITCNRCNGVGKNLPFLARAWARDRNAMDDTDIVLSTGFVQNLIFDTLRYMVKHDGNG